MDMAASETGPSTTKRDGRQGGVVRGARQSPTLGEGYINTGNEPPAKGDRSQSFAEQENAQQLKAEGRAKGKGTDEPMRRLNFCALMMGKTKANRW